MFLHYDTTVHTPFLCGCPRFAHSEVLQTFVMYLQKSPKHNTVILQYRKRINGMIPWNLLLTSVIAEIIHKTE